MAHIAAYASACLSTFLVYQCHNLLKHHCEATEKHSNNNQPLIGCQEKTKTVVIIDKVTYSYGPKSISPPILHGFESNKDQNFDINMQGVSTNNNIDSDCVFIASAGRFLANKLILFQQ
jgi:uncharacterized CHY-type Zn-finger protein